MLLMILCLPTFGGCFPKQVVTTSYTPAIPPAPQCPGELARVEFGTTGPAYSLDEDNARALAVNVLSLKSCIDDYRLWAGEVKRALDPVK